MKKHSSQPVSFKVTADQILETMAEGVVVVDNLGVIRRWNQAMSDITGYTEDEALGQPFSWLRFPGCTGGKELQRLLANNAFLDLESKSGATMSPCLRGCECALRGRHEERIPVLVNAKPLHNTEGQRVGVLNTITDFRPVYELRRELADLRGGAPGAATFHGLIGADPAMREIYRLIELAATSDVSVLITGESGTGKELVANAVHKLSHRADNPLLKVNCGALSETILESELFGHVKGAFTGAFQDRTGRFEAADSGTIFLDEIGEVSPRLQVKLLRVLQNQQFERVGESYTRQVDVRVIAATNRDLAAAMRHGKFREDLYYRLRVFPIRLPPLRQRKDDIPLLVEHFMARFREKTGRLIRGLDEDAMRAVMDYCWPGNIRELENAIEYAFVTCHGEWAGIFDLPEELRRLELRHETCRNNEQETNSAPAATASGVTTAEILRDPDRLAHLIAEAEGNKAEAARRLGVSRKTIWKWHKRHKTN